MNTYASGRAVRAVLRRRLLVNALVDPVEAAVRLPPGIRPHVTAGCTIVGCCLLEIEQLRPAAVPAAFGIAQLAVACRISAEWTDRTGHPTVGVWVPGRRTTSRLAVAAGGRWFSGMHRGAAIELAVTGDRLAWGVADSGAFHVDAIVSAAGAASEVCDVVGGTCLEAAIGVSADPRGRLEAARMTPSHLMARPVVVEHLAAAFIDSFDSALPAPSYLMEHVTVEWTAASPPAPVGIVA